MTGAEAVPDAPLLIRFGALGDLVMAIPAMRALAARHLRPCAVVAHGLWAPALLAGLPFVGAVHVLPSRRAPYWLSPAQWRLVRTLRQQRGGPAWLLESDAKSEGLCARAGLHLAGSLRAAGFRDDEHQVDLHRRVLGLAGDPAYRRDPELAVAEAERSACRAWLAALGLGAAAPVVVHPGNKRTQRGSASNHKGWPAERWIATIRAVRAALPAHPVVVTGTPGEAAMTAGLAAAVADPMVRSVAGQTPLRRLLALLALAHSCISVDTGPAHAAAALGCPLVVLFGRTDPRVNGPIAARSPVRIVTGPPGAPEPPGEAGWWRHHDMAGIASDAVAEAWRGLGAPGRG